jgi:hypothetical protein
MRRCKTDKIASYFTIAAIIYWYGAVSSPLDYARSWTLDGRAEKEIALGLSRSLTGT